MNTLFVPLDGTISQCLSPGMVLFVWVIPAKWDKTTKHENIYDMRAELSCVLLGGTIFLDNTIQRDKTTKFEDVCEM